MRESMLMSNMFNRFAEKSPVSVIARAAMEHALAPDAIDALFAEHADKQYTRDLLFSTVVDLMSVVVCKIAPSVLAAYQAVDEPLPVAVTSLYNKLNGLEPSVTRAMVHHVASRLSPVISAMGGQLPALLPGHRVRILDGNHLAATERRLEVLRGSIAGPLPGHALVVLDPAFMLATDMIPCEDGHAQERSLSESILGLVEANDLWVADRNFCTIKLLSGIVSRNAFYVIRHHAGMPLASAGTLRKCGRTATGMVHEQSVTILLPDGKVMKARRIVIRLDAPTRDGDTEMAILTNLPKSAADAVAVAELYRNRWTLETMFQSLTLMLEGEVAALGYPRAALFGFGIALAAYNVLSTVQAALRAAFGVEKVQKEVSGYYIAEEVRATARGMAIAIEPIVWKSFQTMPPAALAKEMLGWASHVQLRKLQRHPRGPKKPVPKRTRYAKETHVSTFRLLAESRKKSP
jgi:hypothetical protein